MANSSSVLPIPSLACLFSFFTIPICSFLNFTEFFFCCMSLILRCLDYLIPSQYRFAQELAFVLVENLVAYSYNT